MHSTRNTRLAAALFVLGYKPSPSCNFSNGAAITIDVEDEGHERKPQWYEQAWKEFDIWAISHPNDPFTYMYKASSARDWIVGRVIHGTHNASLELPTLTYKTHNLNFACCLVAANHYLLKLNHAERVFHFDIRAGDLWEQYLHPTPNSPIDWQTRYLRSFDWLLRCIKNRNLILDKRPALCKHQPS